MAREANPEKIDDITNIPAEQLKTAVAIVTPTDRYLLDAIARSQSQSKDFDIKHVAVDLLAPEKVEGDMAAEELEAALGIGDTGQADDGLEQNSKTARSHPAVERLAALDQAAIQRTRTGDHIELIEPGYDFIELLKWHLVVGVGVADDGSRGQRYCFPDTPALTQAFRMSNDLDSGIRLSQFQCTLSRAVDTISSHNDLVGISALIKVRDGSGDSGSDHCGFIEGR